MSYWGFLARFIIAPFVALGLTAIIDARRGKRRPDSLRHWRPETVIAAHSAIALAYTTPWDNYLVATKVWWYDPKLVAGGLIGYVPVEEYSFFILQPLLTGVWLMLMARYVPLPEAEYTLSAAASARTRQLASMVGGAAWLAALGLLVSRWKQATYLGLLFTWALPPLIFQAAFGADILWRYRKLLLLGILPPTLYLAAVDRLAISSGTWTINPEKSVGINLFGRLPLEEFLFFLMTNTLIAVGVTLMAAKQSRTRAEWYIGSAVKAIRCVLGR